MIEPRLEAIDLWSLSVRPQIYGSTILGVLNVD